VNCVLRGDLYQFRGKLALDPSGNYQQTLKSDKLPESRHKNKQKSKYEHIQQGSMQV
jgi:hypothetical protein